MPQIKVRFFASIGGNDAVKADLLFGKELKLKDDDFHLDKEQFLQIGDVKLKFKDDTEFPLPGEPERTVTAWVKLNDAKPLPFDDEKFSVTLSANRDLTTCTLALKQAAIDFVATDFGPMRLKEGRAELTFGDRPWQLEIKPTDGGKTVGEMNVLGALFEIAPFKVNAGGIVEAEAKAIASNTSPEIGGLERLSFIEGRVTLAGPRIQAMIKLSFSLPYFAGSKGLMEVHLSRQKTDDPWLIATSSSVNSDATWTDPSGWLRFSKMGLNFDLSWTPPPAGVKEDGKFSVKNPRASGTVVFRSGDLAGAAKEWIGGLFSGLQTEFRDTSLTELGKSNFQFNFNPSGGFQIRAMGILQLNIASLTLGADFVDLGGISLELENLAGATLRGGVSGLKISLRGTPQLSMATTSIDVGMSAPGGIKASGTLNYVNTETLQALEGRGSLTTPTFPGVSVMFRIGRAKLTGQSGWIPTVVIYAAVPVVIQLFPGVVIRQIALGLGINAEISGTSRLTLAQARARLGQGLPDASSLAAWTASNTPLVLVARAFAASSQGPDNKQMDLYVCDLTLIVTSDFQIAVLGKLWLQTSMDDAQTPAFQALPSAVAMLLIDGQEPSLRLVAQTNSNGKTSLSSSGLVGKLLGSSLPVTHLAMEATPNGMALVVGPNPIAGDLGPLQISGSTLLAFRSTQDQSYALLRSTLQAGFSSSASMSFGPVSIRASMRFGFASELVLLGFYKDGSLVVYGRAHVVAFVAVNVHIRIGFEIRISLPFGQRITISWSRDWDFDLQVHVDLQIELALQSDGGVGIVGNASISINLVGVQAMLSVPLSVNPAIVNTGRVRQQTIEADLDKLLG